MEDDIAPDVLSVVPEVVEIPTDAPGGAEISPPEPSNN